jgi:Ca2+-binding RTX toxin-like protein
MSFHGRIALSALVTAMLCGAAAGPAGAVTAEISGATLLVKGGDASERIIVGHRTGFDGGQSYTVSAFEASSEVRMNVIPGSGCAPSIFGVNNDDVGMAICNPAPVQAVMVEGLAGNDELQIAYESATAPRTNKIVVPVRLEGGAGADELSPDTGPTVANGGAGNDTIDRRCGPGTAKLTGGTGNDGIRACSPDTGDTTGGPVKVIEGGPGVDTLEGSAGRDRISGGGGFDSITGHAGADRLDGGAGPDQLIGGKGDDRLLGRAGADGMIDFQGDDVMIGAAGDDNLIAVSNNGSAATGSGRFAGGAGNDSFLIRNRRRDRASGGAGRDVAQVDRRDSLRSIEDVVTRGLRVPRLTRL